MSRGKVEGIGTLQNQVVCTEIVRHLEDGLGSFPNTLVDDHIAGEAAVVRKPSRSARDPCGRDGHAAKEVAPGKADGLSDVGQNLLGHVAIGRACHDDQPTAAEGPGNQGVVGQRLGDETLSYGRGQGILPDHVRLSGASRCDWLAFAH